MIAVALAVALDLARARELPWRAYVASQIERKDDRVLPPPPDIAVYFGDHAKEIEELRRHPEEIRDSGDHMLVTRILVAHGLSHHDWEDFRAAWDIQLRTWQNHGDLTSRMVALAGSRMVAAGARKLPAPAPMWFRGVVDFDAMSLMYGAFDDEARLLRESANPHPPRGFFNRVLNWARHGYDIAAGEDYAHAIDKAAYQIVQERRCLVGEDEFARRVNDELAFWNFDRAALPSLSALWQRTARFTLEAEESLKTLELKAGQVPSPASQCTDGTWVVAGGAVRFRKKA